MLVVMMSLGLALVFMVFNFFTSSIASMTSSPSTLPMSFLDTIFGPFQMSFKSCKWGLSYYWYLVWNDFYCNVTVVILVFHSFCIWITVVIYMWGYGDINNSDNYDLVEAGQPPFVEKSYIGKCLRRLCDSNEIGKRLWRSCDYIEMVRRYQITCQHTWLGDEN